MIEKNINHTLFVESLDGVFRPAEIFSFLNFILLNIHITAYI